MDWIMIPIDTSMHIGEEELHRMRDEIDLIKEGKMRVTRVIRKGIRVVTDYNTSEGPFTYEIPTSYIELHDRKKRVAKRKATKLKYNKIFYEDRD